jgi:hypothetical protein
VVVTGGDHGHLVGILSAGLRPAISMVLLVVVLIASVIITALRRRSEEAVVA